jgi:hypothetical protein
MLVDMNTVTQCMVVSSTLSSVCLPINPNAADGIKIVGWVAKVSSRR